MSVQVAIEGDIPSSRAPAWSAVFALTLCVGTLIASEFMPVSLLTPIASGLDMTEGRAGQAIAVSGLFAVLTSLAISSATRGIDRRIVLLTLTLLMMASGFMVAFAPNAMVFMAGRALIGVVIGGFWSMSAATVMRLVPKDQVARALAILNGGNALATTIAAPVGSFLGQYIGWRGAFFCVVPLAALTLAWQFVTLPSMPSERGPGSGSVFRVLRRPQVPLGMLAVTVFFMGQFALFTYLRPFLETVTRVDVSALSADPADRRRRRSARDVSDRLPSKDATVRPSHRDAHCHGRHRGRPNRSRQFRDCRGCTPRRLGADRDRCACRVVDVAEQGAP